MIKNLLLSFFFSSTLAGGIERYKGHSVLRIQHNPSVDAWLEEYGLPQWIEEQTAFENGVPVSDVLVNEHGRNAATAAAASGLFAYRIMIEDLGDLIDSQRVARETMRESSLERKFDDEYHTLDEIWAQMQTLANAHDIASYVDSIGTSHQGRKIPVLRFGGSQSTLSFWIQGGMHAREWISPATVMSVVEQLLTSTDPAIQALLQQIEFVVAPVINPDGYVYTWTTDRMWRKNRRPLNGRCQGVDLNRNWGDHFGVCGTSLDTCSEVYRGTGAFSEPETAAVANYVVGVVTKNRQLVAAIDFHSYGELIMRPYGWISPSLSVPANNQQMSDLADKMVIAIRGVSGRVYRSQHAAELYCASGCADDWFYTNATQQSFAGGFTVELPDKGHSGFLVPPSYISEVGKETFQSVRTVAEEVVAAVTAELPTAGTATAAVATAWSTFAPKTCSELGWGAVINGVCGESDKGLGPSGTDLCHADQSWQTAADTCAEAGARLCTVSELESGVASLTGCMHDTNRVWTSSWCGLGGKRYVINGNGVDSNTKKCKNAANPKKTFAVRCCSDARFADTTNAPATTTSTLAAYTRKSCATLGWTATVNGVCGEADKGLKWKDGSDKCYMSKVQPDANKICSRIGARLCTTSEITSGSGKATGCSMDSKHVWTSTACGAVPGYFYAARVNGLTECIPAGEKRPVKCCTEESIADAFNGGKSSNSGSNRGVISSSTSGHAASTGNAKTSKLAKHAEKHAAYTRKAPKAEAGKQRFTAASIILAGCGALVVAAFVAGVVSRKTMSPPAEKECEMQLLPSKLSVQRSR